MAAPVLSRTLPVQTSPELHALAAQRHSARADRVDLNARPGVAPGGDPLTHRWLAEVFGTW